MLCTWRIVCSAPPSPPHHIVYFFNSHDEWRTVMNHSHFSTVELTYHSLIDIHWSLFYLTVHLAVSLLCILCTWCENHALNFWKVVTKFSLGPYYYFTYPDVHEAQFELHVLLSTARCTKDVTYFILIYIYICSFYVKHFLCM